MKLYRQHVFAYEVINTTSQHVFAYSKKYILLWLMENLLGSEMMMVACMWVWFQHVDAPFASSQQMFLGVFVSQFHDVLFLNW